MPKKGKGKGKGKGKKKGKDKKALPPLVDCAADDVVDEMSKRFYTIQIVDLEERLSRYQVKCDRLQLRNDDLEKKLHQQLEDQEQMITFLKRKNQQQAMQFMDLEEKLVALRQAKEMEREKLEAQLTTLKEDSQRALDQAAMENKMLQAQLDALENFKQNKEKLENDLKIKDEMIEQLKKEHEEMVYNLEKKAVLDKDRMKKEMVAKVNSVAAEFRKVSDIQMAETTKRAIRENVSVNQQLSKMSDKTIAFIRENEQLKQKEKDLIRKVEILEYSNQELTRKNVSCQKVLRLMRDKVGEREAWNSELEQKAIRCTLMEQDLRLAQEDVTAKERETTFLNSHVKSLEDELAIIRAQLDKTTAELASLQNVASSASATIQGSIKVHKPDSGEKPRRENLLSTLLQLLRFESNEDLCEDSPIVVKYQPGDLGFVPTATNTTTRDKPKTVLPPIDNKNLSITSLLQRQA